ncbi:MAG: phosphoribosylformylglycinamidine cyclo-ligase [Candidatus Bathyarchaeota archaeon]|nr:MAG: phosphoribosylformylglycinamidine cyclo-ligase [Candidatus Bathyarchaeota archaeon]
MSRYKALGVDVKKKGISAFKGVVDNLFPGAFCVITADPANPDFGLVFHADSAGSKPVLSYLCYKESGDPGWFKGLAQDAVAMNIDDVICVAAEPIAFIDYVAINTMRIDRVEMLRALSEGFANVFETLEACGMPVLFSGGETADLPDQMRTLDVCGALFARVELGKVVSGYEIAPGDLIVGLRSGGKISYEEGENSGIMCNGLTLARNCLLSSEYLERYSELAHPGRGRLTGRFRYDDQPDELGMTIGEALSSPTRIFAPVAAAVLGEVGDTVHGMVHNTGGGQTKCLGLGGNIRYVKDSLPEADPIFRLIQREAGVEWREMYEDFNMGVGFEFIVEPEAAEEVTRIAEGFGVGVQVVGHCEVSSDRNSLVIESDQGNFSYLPA